MPTEPDPISAEFIRSCIALAGSQKRQAEAAVAQLTDTQLHQPLAPQDNTIAVIMQHMAGNMRSRWIAPFSTDGEKPDRHRDNEFVDQQLPREQLLRTWNEGWECYLAFLRSLSPDDLLRTVTIRGVAQTALDAIHRQMSHYGYHVGQIILIARLLAGDKWRVLTIPRGQSEEYNRRMWGKS